MFMLEDLTDDQLAEYHLAWAPDGGPSLVYDNHYDIPASSSKTSKSNSPTA